MMLFRVHRALLALLFAVAATVSQAATTYHLPNEILYSAGLPAADLYTADKAIDDDPNTFTAILDDTLDGSDPATVPAYAAGPTTGHMIFDMGEVLDLTGVELTSRHNASGKNPKDVDFFYFADGSPIDSDDIEGDSNLVSIANSMFSALSSGQGETQTWDAVSTRYIGMRVNSSYEEGPVYFNYQFAEIGFLTGEINPDPDWLSPQAVIDSSGSAAAEYYTAEKVIDSNPNTFTVLLDDTLDGDDSGTTPDYAAAPTTGHMIFDLGQAETIYGAKLISRMYGTAHGPKDIDFFYFADDDPSNNALIDDIEGDADIVLLGNHELGEIVSGESETVAWDDVTVRYIGMRVNSSYVEGPVHFNFQLAEIEFSLVELSQELLAGDANGDGTVDDQDAATLATNWQTSGGATWGMGDFNGDGNVDDIDATILATNWQASTTASASVPEPSALALLLGGAFLLIRRRRG